MPSGKKEESSIAEKRISVLSLSKPVLAIVAEAGLDLELKLMPSCLHLRFLLLPACAHPLLVLSGLSMMKLRSDLLYSPYRRSTSDKQKA